MQCVMVLLRWLSKCTVSLCSFVTSCSCKWGLGPWGPGCAAAPFPPSPRHHYSKQCPSNHPSHAPHTHTNTHTHSLTLTPRQTHLYGPCLDCQGDLSAVCVCACVCVYMCVRVCVCVCVCVCMCVHVVRHIPA